MSFLIVLTYLIKNNLSVRKGRIVLRLVGEVGKEESKSVEITWVATMMPSRKTKQKHWNHLELEAILSVTVWHAPK